MKNTPGSPVFHAFCTILSKICRASFCPTTCCVRGLIRSYISPLSTARMNASVMATEMLKLVILVMSCLQSMKSSMSGWSTRRMPMLAPRRVPPCFTTSVDESYSDMKLMGPLATPVVLRTRSPEGRMRLNEKPVPPPDWCTMAMERSVSYTPLWSLLSASSTGSTKQALSWPRGRPAFMSVGELGSNSRRVISR